jgi:hypothetical protein
MMKKFFQKTILFLFTAIGILVLLPVLQFHSDSPTLSQNPSYFTSNPTKETIIFASLPETRLETQTSFKTADARAEIVRQYLAKHKSDLEPYSELIVQLADQYNFDYRWLVAIAQQESNLCEKIPENSFNCWGWGIYGDKVTRFESYEDALNSIAPQFKQTFLKDEHLKDPYQVMEKYTPPSDGSWAFGVLQFFKELE